MTAIQARGLTKRFGATSALADVNLTVAEGEVRGLLGPNGAGKTTLLRVLFGLVAADEGDVELLGHRLQATAPGSLAGVGGFVEHPAFYPYLSARANLELLAELDGGHSPGRIDQVLGQVGLADRAGDRVGGFSSGMRQRLGIAAALLRAPRLLLLDEPTAGLDPGGVRDVAELLGELAADGVAVLLSSHLIGEIESVCHSYTMIRRGEVVWDGTAARLRSEAQASSFWLTTSDDARTLELAAGARSITEARPAAAGLELDASQDALDGLVLALAGEGIAVRRLELRVSPLESMFFALTG